MSQRGARLELPLDGILVLDFSQFLAGPVSAMRLADLGAEAVGSTPAEQDAILKRQMDQFRAVIREMKLE
jgi:crotonobetainyl-CoA:carnitine CoA-transferase CaiB-like acyl-CoA transferase